MIGLVAGIWRLTLRVVGSAPPFAGNAVASMSNRQRDRAPLVAICCLLLHDSPHVTVPKKRRSRAWLKISMNEILERPRRRGTTLEGKQHLKFSFSTRCSAICHKFWPPALRHPIESVVEAAVDIFGDEPVALTGTYHQ